MKVSDLVRVRLEDFTKKFPPLGIESFILASVFEGSGNNESENVIQLFFLLILFFVSKSEHRCYYGKIVDFDGLEPQSRGSRPCSCGEAGIRDKL